MPAPEKGAGIFALGSDESGFMELLHRRRKGFSSRRSLGRCRARATIQRLYKLKFGRRMGNERPIRGGKGLETKKWGKKPHKK